MANAPDRRRYTGPETSWPVPFAKARELSELIDEASGLRADGRKPDEARPIYLKTGLVPQANGSAYIETGKTKIICAVYGPHPARKDAPFSPKAKLNVEVKFAPFATRDRRRAPGKETEATSLSAQLSQALLPSLRLDLMPKAAIDLYLTILEANGPLDDISAGITASSVALASAGVQMYGLVVGCSANMVYNDDDEQQLFFDATYDEAVRSRGTLSLACMPAMSSTTTMSFSGSMARAELKAAIKQLQQTALRTHAVAARALLEGKQDAIPNGVS